MTAVLVALTAGALTIAAPCVLPMLPIILGASLTLGAPSPSPVVGRTRPLFVVAGFVATFAATGILLGQLAAATGVAPGRLREAAIVLLAGFGVLMIWPAPFERVAAALTGMTRRADAIAGRAGTGRLGAVILGAMLGVLWTPCAGPVLGAILTMVATAEDAARATTLLIAYAVGAALPMLAIAYGGQQIVRRVRGLMPYTRILQRAFGVLVIATALAMHTGLDAALAAKLTAAFAATDGDAPSLLADAGPAPELAGITTWVNSPPLTLRDLRGKVVLIDFWTFGCVNCLRTLPHVVEWYRRYAAAGLVVIGVHTPEFPHERATADVQAALARHGITYPVAQDNDYATWKAYDNHYWPAQYLVDRRGHVVLTHFGEGHYEEMEDAIRTLLGIASSGAAPTPPRRN